MPVRAFLSHASADKPFVEEVKLFLEEGGDIECWLDTSNISFGENIVSRLNDGLAQMDFLLLFLSPAALKSSWVEEEWTATYFSQVNSGSLRVIPVLLGDAQPPLLLQNKKYCDLRTNQLEGMRLLKARLLRTRTSSPAAGYPAASLPNFVGREWELDDLKERLARPGSLVPIVGMPGLGKTYLAREFIRRHGALFEAVYALDCEGKDFATLAGELAGQMGILLDGEVNQIAAELRGHLSRKRCLLFLDNVETDEPGAFVSDGRAAILITSRNRTIPFLADHPALSPPLFTDAEASDLLRRVVGDVAEGSAKQLFRRLGHLPIAIAVCAGLIKNDIRYTTESLLAEFPSVDSLSHGKNNVGLVLRTAIVALDDMQRKLLVAMSACAPNGVRLGFATEVAGIDAVNALDALQGLFSRSLVVELDRSSRRYRVHTLIREATFPSEEVRRKHAQCVLKHLGNSATAPIQSAEFIEEAEQVADALANDREQIGLQVAHWAGHLAHSLGRMVEAYQFYRRVQDAAMKDGDKYWLGVSFGNQSMILHAWGRLDEAMALLHKTEAICKESGDLTGLQASYGNQALILKTWGRLDEAMTLHEKEEAICKESSDLAGLQACYGNQALILKTWGRLDDAMALLQKKKAICQDLGNRVGLQRTYGNQAIILTAMGRLDEAMMLHNQEEAICNDLCDRAGLQRTYGNQAAILIVWGRLDEAMTLLEKQETICRDIGDRVCLATASRNQATILHAWDRLDEAMKLLQKSELICQDVSDRNGLQETYSAQAHILKDWVRLDEALVLLKRQEAICYDLGDRVGLQCAYGDQALILRDWGRLDEAMELLKKQEVICNDLAHRAGLQRTYGHQALVLWDWGCLDEALALLKKQEEICNELGDRASLAYCYWNLGLLEKVRNNSDASQSKLDRALTIFTELKMVRQRDDVLTAMTD